MIWGRLEDLEHVLPEIKWIRWQIIVSISYAAHRSQHLMDPSSISMDSTTASEAIADSPAYAVPSPCPDRSLVRPYLGSRARVGSITPTKWQAEYGFPLSTNCQGRIVAVETQDAG